ncbi:hypothetical protein M513_12414 [Trichuris suis]|uniref:Uncharacterized protein n=1 Tax=Trichuris suis TaxID=68888 RepID=A0A085LP08_9BILA|nr:hypothetical protein M513_12414 [Trichuris suis]
MLNNLLPPWMFRRRDSWLDIIDTSAPLSSSGRAKRHEDRYNGAKNLDLDRLTIHPSRGDGRMMLPRTVCC